MNKRLILLLLIPMLLSACASTQEAKKPIWIFGNDGTTWIRPECPYVVLGDARADTQLGSDGRIGARGDNRQNYINPLDRVDPDADPLGYLKEELQERARQMGGDALIKLVEMKEMGTGRTIALTCDIIKFTDPNCSEPEPETPDQVKTQGK
jgi:hypothetical protein